jgi:predicted transcriptional regulator
MLRLIVLEKTATIGRLGGGYENMPDHVSNTERQLTTEIVAAFARRNHVTAEELAGLIATVHQTIVGLGKPPEEARERAPAASIRRSVHRNYVTCIECGWRGLMLRRHLSGAHGLTPNEYRARWRLSSEHPVIAPAYSERRSSFAKQIGLGQRRKGSSVGRQRPQKTASPRKTASKTTAKRAGRRRSKRA